MLTWPLKCLLDTPWPFLSTPLDIHCSDIQRWWHNTFFPWRAPLDTPCSDIPIHHTTWTTSRVGYLVTHVLTWPLKPLTLLSTPLDIHCSDIQRWWHNTFFPWRAPLDIHCSDIPRWWLISQVVYLVTHVLTWPLKCLLNLIMYPLGPPWPPYDVIMHPPPPPYARLNDSLQFLHYVPTWPHLTSLWRHHAPTWPHLNTLEWFFTIPHKPILYILYTCK